MEEIAIDCWIARDKSGGLWLYEKKAGSEKRAMDCRRHHEAAGGALPRHHLGRRYIRSQNNNRNQSITAWQGGSPAKT